MRTPIFAILLTAAGGVLLLITKGLPGQAIQYENHGDITLRTKTFTIKDADIFEEEQIQKLRHQHFQSHCRQVESGSWQVKGVHQGNMYIIDQYHKVLLLTLPKTGSTLWKLTFYNNTNTVRKITAPIQFDQNLGIVHEKTLWRSIGFQSVLEIDSDKKKEILETYFKIITVRHPLDRIESAFTDKIVNYQQVSPKYRKCLVEFVLGKNGTTVLTGQVDLKTEVTFEDFLYFIDKASNRHWTSINTLANPCSLIDSYIAKTETLNMDLQYIIRKKLSGRGQAMSLHMHRKQEEQTSSQRGRYLPLFSGVPNVAEKLKSLMPRYQNDMDMFGYSYDIVNGQVFATCTSYTESGICI